LSTTFWSDRGGALGPLLDDLIGGGQQRFRNGEAERLGSLQVDDQLKLGGLHHGKVGGLGTASIKPNLTVTFASIAPMLPSAVQLFCVARFLTR
jgi:hypothetical protein